MCKGSSGNTNCGGDCHVTCYSDMCRSGCYGRCAGLATSYFYFTYIIICILKLWTMNRKDKSLLKINPIQQEIEMRKYFKWEANGKSGRFMIENKYGTLFYKCVSGFAPADIIPLYVILANVDLAKTAMVTKRTCPWKRQVIEGMSGCTDWYIQYFNEESGAVRRNAVWHSSMFEKANENLEVYIKDIFDIFADTECIARVKECWSKGIVDEVEITKEILGQEEQFQDLVLYRDFNYENLVKEFESSDKGKEFYYDFPDSGEVVEGDPDEGYARWSPSPDDPVDEDELYK